MAATADGEQWKVLLVDDEPSVHAVLGALLRRMGHSLHGVMDAPAAAPLLQEPWDLFIFDKNLPSGSGVELAQAARAAHPEAVVVMVTGFATRETADALVGVADEYLSKPFDLNVLKDTLTELMHLRSVGRVAKRLQASPPSPASLNAALGGPLDPFANRPAPSPATAPAASQAAPTVPRPSPAAPPPGPSPSSAAPTGAPRPAPSPLPASSSALQRAMTPLKGIPRLGGGSAAAGLRLHIIVADARDESALLTAARLAGHHATSGPLADDAFPDLLVVDGKSATFDVRKAVWWRQARSPDFRVALVTDGSVADASTAVALKASARVERPVSAAGAEQLMASFKR